MDQNKTNVILGNQIRQKKMYIYESNTDKKKGK